MHLSYVCGICKAIRSTSHTHIHTHRYTHTHTHTHRHTHTHTHTHTHKCRQTAMQTCTESHTTTQMHDSVVGVSRCRLRASTSRSGGETTAASHSKDSLDYKRKKKTFVLFCFSLPLPLSPTLC